jgi:AcrR family transcriptional regulator
MSTEAGHRILDAAVALLGEKGWEGLSMEALASRAGSGKATIYRRWSSKEEIVIAALERFVEEIRLPDTGSLRSDLEALLNDATRAYRTPRGALVPALASVMERQPRLAKAVRSKFLEPRRRAVFGVFERARKRGELEADADLDLIHDLLVGPILYRRLFTGMPLDSNLVEGTVEAIVSSFGSRTRRADKTTAGPRR